LAHRCANGAAERIEQFAARNKRKDAAATATELREKRADHAG
jgi:hypothetical protein